MSAAPSAVRAAARPDLGRLPRRSRARADGETRLLALLACARIEAAGHDGPEAGVAPWPALRVELDSRWGTIGFVPLREGRPTARLCGDDGTPDLSSAADALESAEPALAALERALATPLVPGALAPLPPGERVEVDLTLPGGAGARLDASPSVLRRLPSPAWTQPPLAVMAFALRCRVRLGSSRLSAASAMRLAADDVLLIALAAAPGGRVHVVAPDGAQGLARFDAASAALCFDPLPSEDAVMSPETISAPPDQGAAPEWTRLPIELGFELPRAEVPLGVLAGMQPGAVIPIAADAAEVEVVIVNGGRPVGRGRLVAVGDGLGVRLAGPLAPLV
ncbi:MAG: FliM/FliN family flagellar motor switch protein [Burkholderiales bacterium]